MLIEQWPQQRKSHNIKVGGSAVVVMSFVFGVMTQAYENISFCF